jgi:diguanylate cyclase (GGDEF)-like protein
MNNNINKTKNQMNDSIASDQDTTTINTELAKEAVLLADKYHKLEDRYTALFTLNKLSSDCTELDTFYRQVHSAMSAIMLAENFFIVIFDQTLSTLEFVYAVDEKDDYPVGPFDYAQLKGSMTCHIIENGRPLLGTPELIEQLTNEGKVKTIGSTGTDWLGVPLINDGIVIGVISTQSYSETTRYQEHDLDLLSFAAQHIVTAMMRLQDREQLQKAVNARTKELMTQIREREKAELLQESLFRISELTSDASIDIETFYKMVHNIVGQLINAENFYIAKYNSTRQLLSFVYYSDQKSVNLEEDFCTRNFSNGFTELVIKQGKTALLNAQDMMQLHLDGLTKLPRQGTKSWLGVPLIQSGTVIGAMVIQSYQNNIIFTEPDAELLKFVSHHVATAIKRREIAEFERQNHELLEQQVKFRTVELEDEIKQRKEMEQQLKHAASHDALTGLANRVLFLDLLNHAIACQSRRPELQFAVLFLDLDRFKVVNDSLGHHAGDVLLIQIAQALKHIIRTKDTVARLGGDEFVILIEDLVNKEEAYDIAQRITELLSTPFIIEGQTVYIGTSIGLLFNDERYNSAEFMLRDADTAMYHAKERGKGRYEVFDASMHNKVQNALLLEGDIRKGIYGNEFLPHFQPIVRLDNEKIVGFEALARWQNKQRGFVYPQDFIAFAEETQLVIAIDFQIMRAACRQLKYWQNELQRDDLYVSCNLYANQFFDEKLPEKIAEILTDSGLKPRNLRLELTERALLENTHIVLNNMKALKKMGLKILFDDFGTGYSSLSYLHRFPIDVLKIDRSFINNAHEHYSHQAIIKTIIDLAKNLQMGTVGEGIENLADAQLLQQMDCMYGQGYYFYRPMPAKQLYQELLDD